MRSTLWAIWLLGPDPFSDAAKHPSGRLAIGSRPPFLPAGKTRNIQDQCGAKMQQPAAGVSMRSEVL